MEYHAHVYFTSATVASAERLLARAMGAAPGTRLHRFVPRPEGPHLKPMFELRFTEAELGPLVAWLMLHRRGHSVLVHPCTGDDPLDHFEHALWLGAPVPLDASRLDPSPPFLAPA
jgi:DOPA 4,5-dioxygenase